MREAFARAFEEWERRYRADPHAFLTDVEMLLGYAPRSLAEARGVYLEALLNELTGGQPWNTIATPAPMTRV